VIRIKLKEVAQAKKMSQRQIFLRSGVDIRTIQRIYKDPFTNITLETLAKLAKVLNVASSDLIEDVDEQPPSLSPSP
jgi:DNA-binding Xre family transcriptional regulator